MVDLRNRFWNCVTSSEIRIWLILVFNSMMVKEQVRHLLYSKLTVGGGALYKLVDPSILIKQREEKAAQAADKAAKKAANAAAAEKQKQAQLEKGRIPPSEMFKPPQSDAYSEWDNAGLPTKDKEGTEVSKAGGKKLLKEYKTQEKLHEAFLAWEKEQ
jgi:cysteinyl-tRNA synthetase